MYYMEGIWGRLPSSMGNWQVIPIWHRKGKRSSNLGCKVRSGSVPSACHLTVLPSSKGDRRSACLAQRRPAKAARSSGCLPRCAASPISATSQGHPISSMRSAGFPGEWVLPSPTGERPEDFLPNREKEAIFGKFSQSQHIPRGVWVNQMFSFALCFPM